MSAQVISLKVAPNPALKVDEKSAAPHIPLTQESPIVVLGNARDPDLIASGVQPEASSSFGPRGSALLGEQGPLWICDTGHHRLLGWKKLPENDLENADWIIGQADFAKEGRNGKEPVSASSVNVPTGICSCGNGMAVADAWNHRVLIWKNAPEDHNVPADIVLGQNDFSSNTANDEREYTSASTFHWPYGVAWIDDHLLVADTGNRRVLIWKGLPHENGQPADLVLGQNNFADRDENAGGEPNAMSMRWPHGIAMWRGHLCISDAGNNRIMIWKGMPDTNGADCDLVLGQTNITVVDHNQSLYWPRANTVNMPYAIACKEDWLIAADTANSRLLAWHIDDLSNGADARALSGQLNFNDKGDNRWQPACADSFCWPYGIQTCGNKLVVADSGNNRVSVWELSL